VWDRRARGHDELRAHARLAEAERGGLARVGEARVQPRAGEEVHDGHVSRDDLRVVVAKESDHRDRDHRRHRVVEHEVGQERVHEHVPDLEANRGVVHDEVGGLQMAREGAHRVRLEHLRIDDDFDFLVRAGRRRLACFDGGVLEREDAAGTGPRLQTELRHERGGHELGRRLDGTEEIPDGDAALVDV